MFPVCVVCKANHHPRQAHRFATNTVRLTVDELPMLDAVGLAADGSIPLTEGKLSISTRTANRRERGAYNAYQREYMRKRRANV